MKNAKKPKLTYGYNQMRVESPAEAMTDNDIMLAKAKEEAANDPWAIGTAMLGGFLMQNAGTLAGGLGGMGGGPGIGTFNEVPGAVVTKGANGMEGGTGKVEVEDGEVYETDDGRMGRFSGKTHEEGGIDVDFGDSKANVFSEQVLIDGKPASERKIARERLLAKMLKAQEKNPTDKLLKKDIARTQANLQKEEQRDLAAQNLVATLMGSEAEKVGLKARLGVFDWMKGLFNGDVQEQSEEKGALGTSFGDMLSIGGNLFSGIAPLMNTLKQRATDTPNINAFEGYGQDALEANEDAMGFVASQKDEALKDIRDAGTTQRVQTRNTSRGVNQLRAGDLATFSTERKAGSDVYNNFAKQMMDLYSSKATLENAQDDKVMEGEQRRDEADRADKDAFYTAKGKDLGNLGTAIQQTGKDLNEAKQQKAMKKILDQLSKYGIGFDKNFNMVNPKDQETDVIGYAKGSLKGLPEGSSYDAATDTYTINGVSVPSANIDKFRK